MNQEKYIGMDVHAATISAAVRNAEGKLLMECVLETKAATVLDFIRGLRGTLALTFEEGTLATWLHDLLKPHVSRLVVCAIHARTRCCGMATRTIEQMPATWQSYCAPTKSRRWRWIDWHMQRERATQRTCEAGPYRSGASTP